MNFSVRLDKLLLGSDVSNMITDALYSTQNLGCFRILGADFEGGNSAHKNWTTQQEFQNSKTKGW